MFGELSRYVLNVNENSYLFSNNTYFRYCVAEMYRNNSDPSLGKVPVAVVCFEEISKTNDIETSGILTLISVFFLVATIAVYTYLPQLR